MKYVYFHNIRKELKKIEFLDGTFNLDALKDQKKLKDTITRETRVIPKSVILACINGGKK